MRARDLILAALALLAVGVGAFQLFRTEAGLVVIRLTVGSTPATLYAPAAGAAAPTVVIAHGFAGSQQLMQPFAVTLARNGYRAVTFDFLGHGRNPQPLRGDVAAVEGATRALVAELAAVAAFARDLPGSDGRLAVLGHSMASDVIVRYAQAQPEVAATVAVSMFSPAVTAASPRNLLVIVGALEPGLKEEGLRVVGMATGGAAPEPGVTYGQHADGTARRVAFAPRVEHVGVLYSPASMAEALAWLNATFGRTGTGYVDARGPWIGLVFLGLVLLARPLSRLLPTVADRPAGAGPSWRLLLPLAVLPALLTPLILWQVPLGFLPVLVGDYLAAHFAVYGLLTGLGLWLAHRRLGLGLPGRLPWRPLLAAAFAVAVYSILIFGWPIDRFLASFRPIPERWPLVLAMLAGMLPYFLADEWLARGPAARRGSYVLTKLCFLLSLALAVALSPERLFFLVIIVPVILLFFVIYGLFSRWAYARTGHPFVGALANAAAFAWAVAVTFPMLSG